MLSSDVHSSNGGLRYRKWLKSNRAIKAFAQFSTVQRKVVLETQSFYMAYHTIQAQEHRRKFE
ncbi:MULTISPECIES: hypothetical protein [unclassified Leptolyngbya]|uniref:hypothetical protein n=1 Tax=unclassified Leptolyngbya TaxID=2650499 RepID=UPI003D323056